MSMISLIEDMKELQERPQPEASDGGKHLLAMLDGQKFNPRKFSEQGMQ